MNAGHSLEQEIASCLTELRDLLGGCSTRSVAGWCFSYHLHLARTADWADRLSSPAKQIPFLLAVLLSGEEPQDPIDFGRDEWERAKAILERVFSAYMSLYMPSSEERGTLAAEWNRMREVSMLAFLHYFNTGFLGSVHQVVERVRTYLVSVTE
jgi:hypothetical protein